METHKLLLFLSHLWDYPRKELLALAREVLAELGLLVEEPSLLAQEYMRLFVNTPEGVPAPPYASYYLTGLLAQEPAKEALSFYTREGLFPEGPEPADHLSYELAFVAHLLSQGKKEALGEFLGQHFWRWFPRFKMALSAAKPHPFYLSLAEITEEVLRTLEEEE